MVQFIHFVFILIHFAYFVFILIHILRFSFCTYKIHVLVYKQAFYFFVVVVPIINYQVSLLDLGPFVIPRLYLSEK